MFMTEQKKVLFTSHTANFAKFNRPLMRDLRKKGYIVHYASAGEEEILNADESFVIPFARSPFRFDQHLKAYLKLKKLLKQENYDLIHCHTPVGGVVTRWAVKHTKLTKRPKVFYTGHGFHFYKGASWINWLLYYPVEKWLARSTDVIITINSEDRERAERKFKAGRVVQIPGAGVDLAEFRPVSEPEKLKLRQKNGLGKADFVLIYGGEINKNKDQALIIDNMSALRAEIPQIKVLFAGVGPEQKRLEKKVRRLGLGEAVKFLGYRNDMVELYRLADVAVSASRREGLGLNLVEGMASGLPIVARDNRGHREIVKSMAEGTLFHNGAEFRAAVLELYQNPAKREEIGKHNVKVAQKFSLEKTRQQMSELYAEYLEN